MARSTFILALFILPTARSAANPNAPHIHQGIMQKYDSVPPSKLGISLGGATAESLRSGKPTIRMIEGKGSKRIVSIQDMQAPEKVIWKVITDLPNYPKMVEGCEACDVYKTKKSLSGSRVDYARYRVGAMGFKMEYYIKHMFEPAKHCFTFHLDYDRLSELSDTVGYWYVEQLDDGWCRVYYSTDSTLPSWIPGFAKESLVNLAAKRATGWVNKYCQIAQGRGVSKSPLTKQRLVLLAALGGLLRNKLTAAAQRLLPLAPKLLRLPLPLLRG